MKDISGIFLKMYSLLLRMYPESFRREFEEQMRLDFSDLAKDAAQRSRFSLLLFCLRELVDFPISLLQAHLKESGMFIKLRTEPLHAAWRGALVFGFAFSLGTLLHSLVFWFEANIKISISAELQFLFERFLLDWIAYHFLTGIAFGLIFAALFADRSKYWHYMLVGTLGWFLQLAANNFLEYFFEIESLLNRQENIYLYNLRSILKGAILGLIFVLAQDDRRKAIGVLTASVIAYPVVTYLYVEWTVDTAWRFPALAILWFMLIGCVFILANTFASNRQLLLLVVAGAFGYIVLLFILGFALSGFMPPVPPEGFLYENPLFWPVIRLLLVFNLALGSLLGFLLGWIRGSQKNSDFQQVLT